MDGTDHLLVLLPGLDGTGELFRPLLDVIPSDLPTRVISYPADRVLSYSQLLGSIEEQLRPERTIVLVAESFSGPLALRYAAAHPERVRGVVLCASFVRPPLPRWLRPFCSPALFRIPLPAFALRRWMVGRGAPDALVQAVKDAIRHVRPEVLAGRLNEVFDVDCVAALRACRAPILVLAGSKDALVRRSSDEDIRRIRDDVQFSTIDAPHLLLQREPAGAWREITRFLSEVTQGKPAASSVETIRTAPWAD